MKRSASSSPASEKPSTPPKIKKESAASTPNKSPRKGATWDAEKKQTLMEIIFEAGVASLKGVEVAEKIGVTPQQYHDAVRRGRKNLRAYVVRAVKDAPASGSPGSLE